MKPNVDHDIEESPPAGKTEWVFAFNTIAIFLGCVFVFPMLICGCCFHPSAVIPTLIPLAWSIFLLTSYRTKAGMIGSWIAFLIAAGWVWVGIMANMRFSPGLGEFLRGVLR